MFGHYGEGPRVVDVLLGTVDLPSSTTASTRDFLQACKINPTITLPLPPPIMDHYEQYKLSWKRRKEKTMSYNEHMGHYKASMKHKDLSNATFLKNGAPHSHWLFPLKAPPMY